jgi:hypothetical protein
MFSRACLAVAAQHVEHELVREFLWAQTQNLVIEVQHDALDPGIHAADGLRELLSKILRFTGFVRNRRCHKQLPQFALVHSSSLLKCPPTKLTNIKKSHG